MTKLNFDNVVNNVITLMKKHNLTQEQFAKSIDTSQSNLNKFLNQNNGENKTSRMLTVEQLYNISTVYEVSLDWLIANKNHDSIPTDNPSIATYITRLYEQNRIVFETQSIKEITTTAIEERGPEDFFPYECKEEVVNYFNIRFPQYEHSEHESISDPDFVEYISDNGNDIEENIILNHFFEGLIHIQKLHKDNLLNDEQYELLKQNLIENTKFDKPDFLQLFSTT